MTTPTSHIPQSSQGAQLTGTVDNLRAGYGFIKGDDNKNYFLHWTSMAKESNRTFRDLEVGDRVSFAWTMAEKGPRAQDVMVID